MMRKAYMWYTTTDKLLYTSVIYSWFVGRLLNMTVLQYIDVTRVAN